MANNYLNPAYGPGQTIDASHINEITLAFLADFVGRNGTGVPTEGMNLGTNMIPWGTLFAKSLVLDGQVLDKNGFGVPSTRIVSGRTNPNSAKSNFLKPSGTGLSFQILGGSTPLRLVVDNTEVVVDTDITVTVAGVTSDNDAGIGGADVSPTAGEADNPTLNVIFPDTGEFSTIYARREFFSAKFNSTNEIYFGQAVGFPVIVTGGLPIGDFVGCSNGFRGFYFDSDLNPITRKDLGFIESAEILKTGWVFLDVNGATVDVSYVTPTYASSPPSDAVNGEYYFNNSTKKWNRYNGSDWFELNRILIGVVASDETKCIAARSFDFYADNNELNTVALDKKFNRIEDDVVYFDVGIKSAINRVNVNGNIFNLDYKTIKWTYPVNKDSYPVLRAASRTFWIYITELGEPKISSVEPYNRKDLGGFYHPYEMWRCLGEAILDTTVDEENTLGVISFKYNKDLKSSTASFDETFIGTTNYGNSVAGGVKRAPKLPFALGYNGEETFFYFDFSNNKIYVPKGIYYLEGYSSARNTGYAGTAINGKTDRVGAPVPIGISGPISLTNNTDNTYHNASGTLYIPDNDFYIEMFTYTQNAATNGLGVALPTGLGVANKAVQLLISREK